MGRLDNYVGVNLRILQFRNEYGLKGRIITEIDIFTEKSAAKIKASIYVEDVQISTGHSLCLDIGDDDALEKYESKAIGRALNNAGYLADSSVTEDETPNNTKKVTTFGNKAKKAEATPVNDSEEDEAPATPPAKKAAPPKMKKKNAPPKAAKPATPPPQEPTPSEAEVEDLDMEDEELKRLLSDYDLG